MMSMSVGEGTFHPRGSRDRSDENPALHRPALSNDGRFIALVTPNGALQITEVVDGTGCKILFQGGLPKIPATFLSHLTVLAWAPALDSTTVPPWLLLSDGTRLFVLNTERLLELAQDIGFTSPDYIAADYGLGDQFGKLSYADFMFNADHVLILFEASGSASILHTNRPQRDDLPNVKFATSRGIAGSSTNRSVSILLRNKGQDQLMLLGLRDTDIEQQSCFNLPTSDAQQALFSPGQDPVLAVWDSPAYGMNLHFFSAMGHRLKTLAITSSFRGSSGLEGVGTSQFKWVSSSGGTIVAVADGNKQILVREQESKTMSVREIGILKHPRSIDGSTAIVWQQTGDSEFSLQKGAFDAVQDASATGDTSLLELNCDQTFLASSVQDNPKTVWIWQPDHPDPHTIITFTDNIRSLLWHPSLPNVLVITTNTKDPILFCWHVESRPPTRCQIPMSNTGSTRYEAQWLNRAIDGRHPFVMTSHKAISYGLLRPIDGRIEFDSILEDDAMHLGDEDDSSQLLTPSKPAKNQPVTPSTELW